MKTIFKTALHSSRSLLFLSQMYRFCSNNWCPMHTRSLVSVAVPCDGASSSAPHRQLRWRAVSRQQQPSTEEQHPNSRQQRRHHPLRSQRQPGNHCRWAPLSPPPGGLHPHAGRR